MALMHQDEISVANALQHREELYFDNQKIILLPYTKTLLESRNQVRIEKNNRVVLSEETIAMLDYALEIFSIDEDAIIANIIDAIEEMQEFKNTKLDLDKNHYVRTLARLELNAQEIRRLGGNASVLLPVFPVDVAKKLSWKIVPKYGKEVFVAILQIGGIFKNDIIKKSRVNSDGSIPEIELEDDFFEQDIEEDHSLIDTKYEFNFDGTKESLIKYVLDTFSSVPIITLEIDENYNLYKITLSVSE